MRVKKRSTVGTKFQNENYSGPFRRMDLFHISRNSWSKLCFRRTQFKQWPKSASILNHDIAVSFQNSVDDPFFGDKVFLNTYFCSIRPQTKVKFFVEDQSFEKHTQPQILWNTNLNHEIKKQVLHSEFTSNKSIFVNAQCRISRDLSGSKKRLLQ